MTDHFTAQLDFDGPAGRYPDEAYRLGTDITSMSACK